MWNPITQNQCNSLFLILNANLKSSILMGWKHNLIRHSKTPSGQIDFCNQQIYAISAIPHGLEQECVQSIVAGGVYLSDGFNLGHRSLWASGFQTSNSQFILWIIHKHLTIKSSRDKVLQRSSTVIRVSIFPDKKSNELTNYPFRACFDSSKMLS